MKEQTIFNSILITSFFLAVLVFVTLLFIAAPYGRHIRRGWGPTINNKIGWVIMEAPAPLVFAACFVLGSYTNSITMLVFFGLWEVHYLHRAFIYPLGLRSSVKNVSLLVMGSGLLFNAVNSYLNGRYLFTFSDSEGYASEWLRDPRFIIGLVLFIAGFIINRQADSTLRHLRQFDESGYKIPQGGLYRWISCPNYLGEIVTWVGWAIATWSLPGLAFAIWTAANLAPRAYSHHIWYQKNFSDYPIERKALVPGLW